MIGDVIRIERIKKGLSKSELARSSGIAISNIHNIETRASKNPGWYTILKIADVLQMELEQLRKADEKIEKIVKLDKEE